MHSSNPFCPSKDEFSSYRKILANEGFGIYLTLVELEKPFENQLIFLAGTFFPFYFFQWEEHAIDTLFLVQLN